MGAATVKGNIISGTKTAISADSSTGRVIGNTLTDNVIGISWSGENSLIADNIVSGGTTGIIVDAGEATVRRNTVEGAENRGMLIYKTAAPGLSGNRLCGNQVNLEVVEGAAVTDDGTNEICEDAPAE